MDDEKYKAIFGECLEPNRLNGKWAAMCMAFSALGKELTGLPIDFQIQPQSIANSKYGKNSETYKYTNRSYIGLVDWKFRDKQEAELRKKRESELRAEADRLYKEEALLKADDQTKMIAFRKSVEAIKIPEVKSAINKRIIEDSKSHLWLAISKINIINQEEE